MWTGRCAEPRIGDGPVGHEQALGHAVRGDGSRRSASTRDQSSPFAHDLAARSDHAAGDPGDQRGAYGPRLRAAAHRRGTRARGERCSARWLPEARGPNRSDRSIPEAPGRRAHHAAAHHPGWSDPLAVGGRLPRLLRALWPTAPADERQGVRLHGRCPVRGREADCRARQLEVPFRARSLRTRSRPGRRHPRGRPGDPPDHLGPAGGDTGQGGVAPERDPCRTAGPALRCSRPLSGQSSRTPRPEP